MNSKNKSSILLENIANKCSILTLIILFLITLGGLLFLGRNRIKSLANRYELEDISQFEGSKKDQKWAKEIMKGGYIIHVRHTERDKWLDVSAYDALETSVRNEKKSPFRKGEDEYFAEAVCLNKKGKIQAKMIGEHLKNINFPIGYVLTSPSCRARQTANFAFGGYDNLSIHLVHSGPYLENREERLGKLKDFYNSIPIFENTNTIISSHNSVIMQHMFINPDFFGIEKPKLEEGGFFVISRNKDGLKMEHEFHEFTQFIRHSYKR